MFSLEGNVDNDACGLDGGGRSLARTLLRANSPANREKYREFCISGGASRCLSPVRSVVSRQKLPSSDDSEQGSNRDRAGNANSLLRGLWQRWRSVPLDPL